MDEIRLFIMLFVVIAILFALYLTIQLILIKKKDITKKEDVVKSAIENCDGCNVCGGSADKFAEKLKNGEIDLTKCPKINMQEKREIEASLDLDTKVNGEKVAFVFCRGGSRAIDYFNYKGVMTCSYMNRAYNGIKKCKYACLGCMDCAKVCPTGAIFKNSLGVAEIDQSLCIGCGKCTKVCPDKLIQLISKDLAVVPACKFCLNGDAELAKNINEICPVGCSLCGSCVNACKYNAINFGDNGELIIDLQKCTKCGDCVKACPSGTILDKLSKYNKK